MGIGVPLPDASAILHMGSTNKGLLIPNVVLTDLSKKDPITAEAKESLLVYNKQEKKEDVTGKVLIAKGYYYWVVTDATTGKWVRVITSEDAGEILDGQVQESFIEEKIDDGTGVEVGTGVFVYTPNKENAADPNAPGRLKLDIPALVTKNQTVTSFKLNEYDAYYYSKPGGIKETTREPKTEKEILDEGWYSNGSGKELELVYTDENNIAKTFAVKDLLGANNENVPAITKLELDEGRKGLKYTDDKGDVSFVGLENLIKKVEAKTKLTITPEYEIVYENEEDGVPPYRFPLRTMVQEPWMVAETGKEAVRNNENIFINGWVGVGLSAADAATAVTQLKPDEKLRVEGSIYARNSYYADYVFENYFTKESSALKYDYNFKDLATVESFIKANYHLPGITPVTELEKTKDSGYLINVSELSIQLLEKVEELYLHTIDQQKIIDQQKATLDKQEARLQEKEALLKIGK
ncbi:hypothetical protein [Myroides sp.]|uniref:hypothetical protein n=1 Tax=Myroides sp. TaxID=1874736 RepID=UPI003F348E66